MKQRVAAAFIGGCLHDFAAAPGADAQRRMNTFDDWLGFDQSDDSWEQPARDRAFAREWETQPERGFPTLAKETSRTPRRRSSNMPSLWRAAAGRSFPIIELRTGMSHPAVVQLRRRLAGFGRSAGLWRLPRGFRFLCREGREAGAAASWHSARPASSTRPPSTR